MAKTMSRYIFLIVFLFVVLHSNAHAMRIFKRDADIEDESKPEEGPDEESGAEEIEPGIEEQDEAEPEKDPEVVPEVVPEADADQASALEPEVLEPEAAKDEEEEPDSGSIPEDSPSDDEAKVLPPVAEGEEQGNEVGSDESVDESSEEFPFEGGFVFDSPFFSFEQIENYFRNLERAIDTIFRKTMESVGGSPETFENTTEQIVEVDGRKYLVHTTVVKGGNDNNAVSIEAVSAVPADKRKKRSLF